MYDTVTSGSTGIESGVYKELSQVLKYSYI